MTTTGCITHDDCLLHASDRPHPECPARLEAVHAALRSHAGLHRADAPLGTDEQLRLAHHPQHVEQLLALEAGGAAQIDADTYFGADSLRAARRAAGGALLAVDRVLDGTWENAFVAARPPGHHAERGRAMGFCLANSIAIAAAHARAARGLQRVFAFDWDVHHGNGTQEIFYGDGNVFYASLHESPLFPHSGRTSERGEGDGARATLNLPQPAGATGADWLRAFDESVLPAMRAHRPELILISAGFDAHAEDPLANTLLATADFAQLTGRVLDAAAELCGGRVVSVLEGGYHLGALAESVAAHVQALQGE